MKPTIATNEVLNELLLILTTKCNQRCYFCCEPPGDPDVKLEKLISWLKKIAASGVPGVDFGGAEPLLYPDLVAALEVSKGLGLRNSISTNGLLLKKYIERLFPFIDQYNMSLHGTAKVHDTIVNRKGSYDIILDASRMLNDKGAVSHITYVVVEENLQDINDTMEQLVKVGVNKVCFNYVFKRGNGIDYQNQEKAFKLKAYQYIENAIKDFRNEQTVFYHNHNLNGQCALVRHNGDVWAVPFNNDKDYEIVFHIDDIEEKITTYPYLRNHKKFTQHRLS